MSRYRERMLRGGFRAATVVAVVMTVAMLLIAWAYDLPVRDPDGVSVPTWVRLPLIVAAAVALDVVIRWVVLLRREEVGGLTALRTVVRDRWHRDQVWFTISGLLAWYASYVAFRNLKNYVPFVNDRLWDTELARLDRLLWLGNDPATVLHHVLGTGLAAQVLTVVYVLWIGLVPATLAIALVWTRFSRTGAWFVTAVSMNWLFGAAVYYAFPSLGPIYSAPGDFDDLPRTFNTTIQEWLLEDRVEVLADPSATQAVQTIAAFASLHVAITVTLCLFLEIIRLPAWIRVSAWVFAGLTVLSTVYLGWHFFVDVLGGVVIGALSLAVAAWATGSSLRRRPYAWSAASAERKRPAYSPASPSS